jgi:hypothetical protein
MTRRSSKFELAGLGWLQTSLGGQGRVPVTLGTYGEPIESPKEDVELLLEQLGHLARICGTFFEMKESERGNETLIHRAVEPKL